MLHIGEVIMAQFDQLDEGLAERLVESLLVLCVFLHNDLEVSVADELPLENESAACW